MFVGLPRMHKESGELRDFLPDFVSYIAKRDIAGVIVEEDYGSGMGFRVDDYLRRSPKIKVGTYEDCLGQDFVFVMRAPDLDALPKIGAGAVLVSMLHYVTQPRRNDVLLKLGIRAVSLDSIVDDRGRRLVENVAAVGWNSMEVAFQELSRRYFAFEDPSRPSIAVTVLGSGAVAGAAAFAAARYGDQDLRSRMIAHGVPGVEVTMIDYDLTDRETYMLRRLEASDILIDSTKRRDPHRRVIPNSWLEVMPQHAVIADLAADPYDFRADPPIVKAIEGIPHGDLDHFRFETNDPRYDEMAQQIPTANRRFAISCYSWPGIHPRPCMEIYGSQMERVVDVVLSKPADAWDVDSEDHTERAVARAEVERWHRAPASR